MSPTARSSAICARGGIEAHVDDAHARACGRAYGVEQFEDADIAFAIGHFGDLQELVAASGRSCASAAWPEASTSARRDLATDARSIATRSASTRAPSAAHRAASRLPVSNSGSDGHAEDAASLARGDRRRASDRRTPSARAAGTARGFGLGRRAFADCRNARSSARAVAAFAMSAVGCSDRRCRRLRPGHGAEQPSPAGNMPVSVARAPRLPRPRRSTADACRAVPVRRAADRSASPRLPFARAQDLDQPFDLANVACAAATRSCSAPSRATAAAASRSQRP